MHVLSSDFIGGGGGVVAFEFESKVVPVLNKSNISLMKMYKQLKCSFTHS
jgi:hypothetical protein